MDWLIYAMGGGWGHLTRALALARAAGPECRVRILTNSPYAGRLESRLQAGLPGVDCFIVDTFPRGLGGELVDVLPSFSGLKVLVARDLNPRYVDAYGVADFVRSNYDLVLSPGDMECCFGTAVVTAPWLIRSSEELLPRSRARALLRLDGEKPCVVVCAAGNRDELAWYGAVVSCLLAADSDVAVRAIAPVCPPSCPAECWVSYWPAVELYNAADTVVGGAGYNTVYECLACGVPLIARPWPRKYDRQWLRASRATERGAVMIVKAPEEAALAARCAAGSAPQRRAESRNGTEEAVALITKKTGRRPILPGARPWDRGASGATNTARLIFCPNASSEPRLPTMCH